MTGLLLALSYCAALLALMGRWRFFSAAPQVSLGTVRMLFVVKVLFGTALWAVYTYVYPDRNTADIFKYFDDSFHMYKALGERPLDYVRMLFGIGNDTPEFMQRYYGHMNNWVRQYESNLYNDAHTIIRFNAAVRLFSFGEFHVHTVVAAFLSTMGSLGIYRIFVNHLLGRERLLLWCVFLMPSVLFWSSGVIKESLLFFGLGTLLYQLHKVFSKDRRWYDPLVAFFALGLLFILKFYVLMSLLPALVFYAVSRKASTAGILLRAVLVYGVFIGIGLNLQHIVPGSDILGILTMKQRDFVGLAQQMNSGSFVMPVLLLPEAKLFARQAPYALYITLLGPLVHAGPGPLGLVSAAENILLIGFVLVCLVFHRPWKKIDHALVIALSGYVIVLALVIGWTTPVMGAVVRYRTPLIPFLLILALCVVDVDRILAPWPRLRRLLGSEPQH